MSDVILLRSDLYHSTNIIITDIVNALVLLIVLKFRDIQRVVNIRVAESVLEIMENIGFGLTTVAKINRTVSNTHIPLANNSYCSRFISTVVTILETSLDRESFLLSDICCFLRNPACLGALGSRIIQAT